MFGADRPVELSLLDIPVAETALEGVRMELEDCAFPLLQGIRLAVTPEKGFEGVDVAILVGAFPRRKVAT